MGEGRLNLKFISMAGRLQGIYTDPRYTEAASFRLLLPEILPEYDSIVYIDCDVIVRQDVGRLWQESDLGDNYMAAVFEAPIEQQAERFRALGCDPQRYFNSGFLIMNLKKMREEKVSEQLLEACRVTYLEFPDQDSLNQVCQGRVLPLSPVYNSIRTFFIPKYKADFVRQYSKELWDEVQRCGTIHYTGGKPWNLFSVRFGDWWRVYESLPEEIRREWTPSMKIMRVWNLYRIRPIGSFLELLRKIKR